MAFEAELSALRMRRRMFFLVPLAVPLGGFFIWAGVPAIVLLPVFAVVLAVGLTQGGKCPRCHESFFYKFPISNAFASRCMHCGLELSPSNSP